MGRRGRRGRGSTGSPLFKNARVGLDLPGEVREGGPGPFQLGLQPGQLALAPCPAAVVQVLTRQSFRRGEDSKSRKERGDADRKRGKTKREENRKREKKKKARESKRTDTTIEGST